MQDKVGEIFSGKVTGMTNFGLFVTLDDIYIEGLVHISDLGEDYFNYLPEIMAIEGERSGVRFSMGDRVTVKVARADLDTSKIDLVLISGGTVGKKGRKPSRKADSSSSENKRSAGKKVKAEAAPAPSKSRSKAKNQPVENKPATEKKGGSRSKKAAPSTQAVQQQSLQMVDGKITLVKKKAVDSGNSGRKTTKGRSKRS